jgi:hypothetical protein
MERPVEKRFRVSWTKKTIPLMNSALFNKAKYSEDWHHSIDATAAGSHPSDPNFPYGFLRNHTDTYLKKKGKINQTDTDIRLAILISSHDAKDIAIAAAAHAMTAQSLRALLHVDENVMHGSYWGLKKWLHCLIAANSGNPQSVTDLEALWARKLLPFAMQGAHAAEWYLIGVARALRETSIQNLNAIQEFLILMKRAIADHSTQLDGFRLRCQWVAAYGAVLWMMELAKTSPAVIPRGLLLPERILDLEYSTWRAWAAWKPDIDRIRRLTGNDNPLLLAAIPDLIALEGPDTLSGLSTLREGLVAQYGGVKPWLRFKGLVIDIAGSSRESLKDILERAGRAMDDISAVSPSSPGYKSMLMLFRELTVSRPLSINTLELFEATYTVSYTSENDVYNAVREIYTGSDQLGGQHILAFQHLVRAFEDTSSDALRQCFLQDWLFVGIEKCIQDCEIAVRSHINKGLPWTQIAIDFHTFLSILKASTHILPVVDQTIQLLSQLPPSDEITAVIEIYVAAQAQRPKPCRSLPQSSTTGRDTLSEGKDMKRIPIPSYLIGETEGTRHYLEDHVETYIKQRLLSSMSSNDTSYSLMTAMLRVWSEPNAHVDKRALAILVARSTAKDPVLGCKCIGMIASGEQLHIPETFFKNLLTIVEQSEINISQAIVALTHFLTNQTAGWIGCWKDLLRLWLEQQCEPEVFKGENVLEHSLQSLRVLDWLSFMRSLEALFPESREARVTTDTAPIPPILRPELLKWIAEISVFVPTLHRLETNLGENLHPIRCILACDSWAKNLLRILECLRNVQGSPGERTPVEVLMHRVVGKLSAKSRNDWEIRECLLDLAVAGPEIIEAASKIWDAKHGRLDIPGLSRHDVPPAVAEVMVAGWVQDDTVDRTNKIAIQAIASILDIVVYDPDGMAGRLKEATVFWEEIQRNILVEAERLEGIQRALKRKDPKGTALLLQELGIPDNSVIDDEIMRLPAEIMDITERVGDDKVELSFSLTEFMELHRSAMGVPTGASNLLVRFAPAIERSAAPSFCLHFNNDAGLDTLNHSPWICAEGSMPPHEKVCTTPQTALGWQLSRLVYNLLKKNNPSIADLYRFMKKRMEDMGHACITCDNSHNARNARLRRSTPCSLLPCARLWYQLPLDVRIPEIRTDIFIIDAMLLSVYAAAMSGRTELLPACPIRNHDIIKTILNSLPNMTVLSHAVNLSTVLKTYHKDAETLISWAVVHHRGYIATATGICKIPNMSAGTHQFVLANASPRLESDFVSKLPRYNPKTTVLFHGTTLDRLPAILAQGLKVCSGTSLQRTGAAHGKGIYMAEEPATSLIYAPAALSWRNSGLSNMRLLLGCEVVGNGKSVTTGIHVITDERSAIVRYLFLLPSSAASPIAGHIVPAMASGMSALRMGTV